MPLRRVIVDVKMQIYGPIKSTSRPDAQTGEKMKCEPLLCSVPLMSTLCFFPPPPPPHKTRRPHRHTLTLTSTHAMAHTDTHTVWFSWSTTVIVCSENAPQSFLFLDHKSTKLHFHIRARCQGSSMSFLNILNVPP